MTVPPGVNVGQSVRNAFVHATAWWLKVADPAPADLNIAKCLRSSQLLRNIMTWFCANDVAREASLAFYGRDGRVDPLRLPCVMALMYVACQVTGMPNWTHAALEAGDLDQNVRMLARQATDDTGGKAKVHTYLTGRLTELATDMLAAMRGLQDREFEATPYFATVSVRETDLLKAMRQLTAVATRLLVLERPASEGDVRGTLRRFVESCEEQPEAVIEGPPEPLAVKLAEQMAEQMASMADQMSSFEQRLRSAMAAAHGAEQIAEAAERQAAAATKAAGAQKPPRAPASTKLVGQVADLGTRLDALESGVARDVGDLMKGLVKSGHRVTALEAEADARLAEADNRLTALDGRLAALETAFGARLTGAEAGVKALEARALEAKGRIAELDAKIEYLTEQAQAQFWSQWHALQMQWAVMCRPRDAGAGPKAAAAETLCGGGCAIGVPVATAAGVPVPVTP